MIHLEMHSSPDYCPRAQEKEFVNNRRKGEILNKFKSLEQRTFTVFVDNLWQHTNLQWIWEVFSREGEVVDVYLSRKNRRSSPWRFAFVRYAYNNHALRAVRNLNGLKVNKVQISVSEAKYGRANQLEQYEMPKYKENMVRENKELGLKMTKEQNGVRKFKDVLTGESTKNENQVYNWRPKKNSQMNLGEVQGIIDEEMKEKLSSSIVGELVVPVKMEELAPKLFHDWHTLVEVKSIGPFQVLMVFDSEESMREALNSYFLLNHFGEIRAWEAMEMNRSRTVWIEIFGMPLHGWCEENFRRVAEKCGAMLYLDKLYSMIEALGRWVIKETQLGLNKGPIQRDATKREKKADLGYGEESCSGLDIPPGFEHLVVSHELSPMQNRVHMGDEIKLSLDQSIKEGDNMKEDNHEAAKEGAEDSFNRGDEDTEDLEETKYTLQEETKYTLQVCEKCGIFFNEDEDVVLATLRRKKKNNEKCRCNHSKGKRMGNKFVQKHQSGIKLLKRLIMSGARSLSK
ncbi:hypothetical protein PIB30_028554 [Stylosanthes scabra]|uniref:RRM domain-containing protein n=1 Tax=Stylosanthes scabra TaxID=79078 RepID=A0ABU6TAR3_9FABA|nr:hypothetical protein [Stylosanthes scabra]